MEKENLSAEERLLKRFQQWLSTNPNENIAAAQCRVIAIEYSNEITEQLQREKEELINLAELGAIAIQVAKDLAEWSNKYPRGRIYGMNRKDDMDRQLIKLEERAKELFPHLP